MPHPSRADILELTRRREAIAPKIAARGVGRGRSNVASLHFSLPHDAGKTKNFEPNLQSITFYAMRIEARIG